MSRIGKLPITVPCRRDGSVDENNTVNGERPQGYAHPVGEPRYHAETGKRRADAYASVRRQAPQGMHAVPQLLHNMVVGVTDVLHQASSWWARATALRPRRKKLNISDRPFAPGGAGRPREHPVRNAQPDHHRVKGISKQQVGNLAADIRAIRKHRAQSGKGNQVSVRAYPPQGRQAGNVN